MRKNWIEPDQALHPPIKTSQKRMGITFGKGRKKLGLMLDRRNKRNDENNMDTKSKFLLFFSNYVELYRIFFLAYFLLSDHHGYLYFWSCCSEVAYCFCSKLGSYVFLQDILRRSMPLFLLEYWLFFPFRFIWSRHSKFSLNTIYKI